MSDPRKAKTLGEACRNPDGTFNMIRLMSWLSECVAPGRGIPEEEVRTMAKKSLTEGKRGTNQMAQNDWQRKQQNKTILTAQGIYAEMIEAMRQEVVNHKDNVITAFVQEQTGSIIADVAEIAKRGYVAQAEDGSEVFHWDNNPRIYFAPVDMQKVNGTLRPVLKYQRIPLPGEPEATTNAQRDEPIEECLNDCATCVGQPPPCERC